MPNWCEGWVKFRGSKEDLIKFITNEFKGANPEMCFSDLIPDIPERTVFLKSLYRSCVYSDDVEEANDQIILNEEGIGIFIVKNTPRLECSWAGLCRISKKNIIST